MTTLYDIQARTATGEQIPMSAYAGDVLLIVNVASQCGYTPQYAGLEQLYRQYRDQGFRVLAFPSNDFGAQEPGTMEEIQQFCTTNYSVSFELFEKVHAIGDDRHPLYSWLISQQEPQEEVRWNFEKFLIGRDGQLLERYISKVAPNDPSLIADIEKAL